MNNTRRKMIRFLAFLIVAGASTATDQKLMDQCALENNVDLAGTVFHFSSNELENFSRTFSLFAALLGNWVKFGQIVDENMKNVKVRSEIFGSSVHNFLKSCTVFSAGSCVLASWKMRWTMLATRMSRKWSS